MQSCTARNTSSLPSSRQGYWAVNIIQLKVSWGRGSLLLFLWGRRFQLSAPYLLKTLWWRCLGITWSFQILSSSVNDQHHPTIRLSGWAAHKSSPFGFGNMVLLAHTFTRMSESYGSSLFQSLAVVSGLTNRSTRTLPPLATSSSTHSDFSSPSSAPQSAPPVNSIR